MKIKKIKAPKWFINIQYILLPLMVVYLAKYLFKMDFTKSENLIGFFLIVLLIIFHTYYHEFFHWVAARVLKYRARVFLSKRLCVVKGKIKPGHFFIIALFPFFLELIIIYFLFTLNQNLIFLIGVLLVTSAGGFLGDLWMALSSIPYFRKKDFYFKYIRSGEFHLCKKQQYHMSKTTSVI